MTTSTEQLLVDIRELTAALEELRSGDPFIGSSYDWWNDGVRGRRRIFAALCGAETARVSSIAGRRVVDCPPLCT